MGWGRARIPKLDPGAGPLDWAYQGTRDPDRVALAAQSVVVDFTNVPRLIGELQIGDDGEVLGWQAGDRFIPFLTTEQRTGQEESEADYALRLQAARIASRITPLASQSPPDRPPSCTPEEAEEEG